MTGEKAGKKHICRSVNKQARRGGANAECGKRGCPVINSCWFAFPGFGHDKEKRKIELTENC